MQDYKTPGVYIEELPANGPIAGVGTSTAAFIGAALTGPIATPVKLTNWTQFNDIFGGFIVNNPPQYFLAYAVRSFFENGGTECYVVRAGNAVTSYKDIPDGGGGGGTALRVLAQAQGTAGDGIAIDVTTTSMVTGATVKKPRVQITSNTPKDVIKLQHLSDATEFSPGDVVTIETAGAAEERIIQRIVADQIFLTQPFTGNYTLNDWVRIADLTGAKTFRVANGGGLQPGSAIHLTDGKAPPTQENAVVASTVADWITLDAPLAHTFTLGQNDTVTITSTEFGLAFSKAGVAELPFTPLSMDPRHGRFWSSVVNSSLVTVTLPPTPSIAPAPTNQPVAGQYSTTGGRNDVLPPSTLNLRSGLTSLERLDDVNLVAVPGITSPSFQGEIVTHCEKMADRFGILDSRLNDVPSLPTKPNVLEHRASLSSERGYAALYYPWIQVTDPASPSGVQILIPPSGAVAGICARSDASVGVHKAPANEDVRNGTSLELVLTDGEQGDLNAAGVNALRMFRGTGRPLVWGARTIAPVDNVAWRYVNVRRLFLYIEGSLRIGLRQWVFDPNDLALWKKLDRTITEFLTRVWRSGALFGAKASEAFYVKIDEENNPESVRALGQVIIEIGLAPVRPAEFIVVRLGMWAGGSNIQESGG